MATIELKDMNNEVFHVDTEKMFNINGDVTDSTDVISNFDVSDASKISTEIQVVDSDGKSVNPSDIIRDIKSGNSDIEGIFVDVEGTHSGKNLNFWVYYEDSMEKDAETFISPFNKPMLKNHDSWSEPLGRVVKSEVGESEFTDERIAMHLGVKVTDQDAMIKFLDHRYQTVSIGGAVKNVTCSICGKHILKDGQFKFCGHMNGRKYNDQVCYWGARDITYKEVSVVNSPADMYARVNKITVITNNGDNNDIEKTKKEENRMDGQSNANTASDQVRESIMNIVDEMLNSKANDSASTPEEGKNVQTNDSVNDAQSANNGEAQDLAEKVKELETKVSDLEKNADELTSKLQTAEDALKAKQEEYDAVVTQRDSYKDKCFALAESNKKMIVDSIIEKEKANGLKAEDEEVKRDELLKLSMKELDSYEVKTNDATGASIEHIDSPTLAENDKVGDSENTVPDKTDIKRKSLNDYTNEIVSKLSK